MSQEGLKVCGLMTLPRCENSWVRTQIQKAFGQAGVPLHVGFGVFYGQCVQRLLEEAIERGADIVVTVDGDSVVTGDQIKRIISLVALTPEIDAAVAIQAKRGTASLLGYIEGSPETKVNGEPVKATLAHFGLTAIDLHKLAATPRPWFWSQPDSDGGWGSGRIDDDIWFWRQWEKAGNSVYLDPQTCIGHMEEMIATVDPKTFKVSHCYPDQWQAK